MNKDETYLGAKFAKRMRRFDVLLLNLITHSFRKCGERVGNRIASPQPFTVSDVWVAIVTGIDAQDMSSLLEQFEG